MAVQWVMGCRGSCYCLVLMILIIIIIGMVSIWCVVQVCEGNAGGMMHIGPVSWPGCWLLPRMSPCPFLHIPPNRSDSVAHCRQENGPICELPTETELVTRACLYHRPEICYEFDMQKPRILL